MAFFPLVAAIALGSVHLIAGELLFLRGAPRSRRLSLAGGVSVAYVSIRLLSDLSAGQEVIQADLEVGSHLLNIISTSSLFGLVTFYVLEKMLQPRKTGGEDREREGRTPAGVFRVHIASFAFKP